MNSIFTFAPARSNASLHDRYKALESTGVSPKGKKSLLTSRATASANAASGSSASFPNCTRARMSFTVTSGANTPGINVVLDPTGGALTGTVRRGDTLQPVVATVIGIREAATGSTVTFISTDANGTFKTEGLAPGSYKLTAFDVLAARYAKQFYSNRSTLESGDVVTVAPVGVTGGIDFLVSPSQGSISGRVFLSDGKTPLAGAGVVIFDSATGGFVRGAGVTDKNGNYSAPGLAPGCCRRGCRCA